MIAILAAASTIVVAPFHIATANPQWAAVFDERTVKALPSHAVRYEVIGVFSEGRPYRPRPSTSRARPRSSTVATCATRTA
jgi:hypothetical protein